MNRLGYLAGLVIRMSELKEKIENSCSTYLERIELKNLKDKLEQMKNECKSKQEA